jgi:hypothetical protein
LEANGCQLTRNDEPGKQAKRQTIGRLLVMELSPLTPLSTSTEKEFEFEEIFESERNSRFSFEGMQFFDASLLTFLEMSKNYAMQNLAVRVWTLLIPK